MNSRDLPGNTRRTGKGHGPDGRTLRERGIHVDRFRLPIDGPVAGLVAPGKSALASFAPPLDEAGNSVKGQLAARFLSERLGLNLRFESLDSLLTSQLTLTSRSAIILSKESVVN